MEENPSNLDVVGLVRVLRRRGWIVGVCVVAAAAAAFGVSSSQPNKYTANASILFQNQQLQQQAAGLPGVSLPNPQTQTDTNLKLASLPRIAERTAAAVGQGTTPAAIRSAVQISQQGDTDLATISATARSARLAAQIANAYAKQAIRYREAADQAYYAGALRAVRLQLNSLPPAQRGGTQSTDLRDRAASLQVLANLQGSELQLAQSAGEPSGPSSPKVTQATVLGAVVGLLIGLGIIFGLERFDRRLREPGQLEMAYQLPLLGVVPERADLKAARSSKSDPQTLDPQTLKPREMELFSLLRAHIRYANVDRDLRVISVVSAAQGDGKSTVSRNLALAAAAAGERVLYIEADLRRPNAANNFGLDMGPGISEILIEHVALNDAVQHAKFAAGERQHFGVDVLVAGAVLPPNPAKVIESEAMQVLIREAKQAYDLVLVDTPPLALLSDAFPLLRVSDGVVIVSRIGSNRRDVAERLRVTLASAGAPLLGVIANGYRQRAGTGYGYGYGYGGYEQSAVARRVEVSSNSASNGNVPAGVDDAARFDAAAGTPDPASEAGERRKTDSPAAARFDTAAGTTDPASEAGEHRKTDPPSAIGGKVAPENGADALTRSRLARRARARSWLSR